MPTRPDVRRTERLFARATAILDDHANGWGEPILRHPALRGNAWGMSEAARRFAVRGRAADRWSATGLNRRAWRAGNATAAWNEAMDRFDRRDLAGYRLWLTRAARAGDGDAVVAIRWFETRLAHGAARDIGRGRAVLPRDGRWTIARGARRRQAMTQERGG